MIASRLAYSARNNRHTWRSRMPTHHKSACSTGAKERPKGKAESGRHSGDRTADGERDSAVERRTLVRNHSADRITSTRRTNVVHKLSAAHCRSYAPCAQRRSRGKRAGRPVNGARRERGRTVPAASGRHRSCARRHQCAPHRCSFCALTRLSDILVCGRQRTTARKKEQTTDERNGRAMQDSGDASAVGPQRPVHTAASLAAPSHPPSAPLFLHPPPSLHPSASLLCMCLTGDGDGADDQERGDGADHEGVVTRVERHLPHLLDASSDAGVGGSPGVLEQSHGEAGWTTDEEARTVGGGGGEKGREREGHFSQTVRNQHRQPTDTETATAQRWATISTTSCH